MLSHLACEVEEGEVLHPVVVVHKFGAVRCIALEVKELGQLFLDAFLVVAQSRLVEQVALEALSRWVANHSCCSSHECYGFMSAALQVTQHHHTAEVSYVQ